VVAETDADRRVGWALAILETQPPTRTTQTFGEYSMLRGVRSLMSAAGDSPDRLRALERGLIDEIDLHIAPVLLDHGIRLLDNPGAPVRLELLNGEDSQPQ
jgi:hypothetical protein